MSISLGEKMLAILAALSDHLFGTHLGQRLLARYDARIAQLERELADIEMARARLDSAAEALTLSTCALVLSSFESSPEGGILFEPGGEQDALLQTSINWMVKPGLASIREHARPGGQFAYELFPRWEAICAYLAELAERLEPQLAAHVRQNIQQVQAHIRKANSDGTICD